MTSTDHTAAIVELYLDREREAREWHRQGGKVVGVLGATVPVEMITAAGLYPLRLVGDPARGTVRSDHYMEPVREGYLRSILEKLLAGDYDYLDLIVIPRSAEGLLQFYYVLEYIRVSEPERPLPAVHLFDLMQTPFDYTKRYVAARMEELRARLETISGSGISDTALTEAIARHDQARSLFGKLSNLGRGLPATISGTTMLHLAGCGQTLPIDTFTALLEQSMNLQSNAGPGPRLMVKGSPQEHAHFYQMVEATGATVVADDHDWGEALYRVPVGSAPDPLTALVNHCMVHRPGPRRLPQDMVDAEFIGLVRERRVDGVIFALEQHDDTLGWDYPAQKRALDELGVPSILLTGQRYDIVEQATTDAVIRFVRELQS